jgi:hypothetical protein
MDEGEFMKIVLICTTCLCGFASLFACLDGDSSFGVYFLVCAFLSGFGLWLNVREDDPADPCIPAEYVSEGVLKENMVIGEIPPADWQLEEVMTARLESCLRRLWRQLNDEWGYDPAAVTSYDDGLVTGFAIATHRIARTFKIDLEKP